MVDVVSNETILPPDVAAKAEGVQGVTATLEAKDVEKETGTSNAFVEKMVRVLLDQTLVDSIQRLEGFAEAVREFAAKKEERFTLPEEFSAKVVTDVVADSPPKTEGDSGSMNEASTAPEESILDVVADPKFGNALKRFIRAIPTNIKRMVRGNTPIFRPIPGFPSAAENRAAQAQSQQPTQGK